MLAAALVLSLVLGAATLLSTHATHPRDAVADPMTDEQARAAVVNATVDVVAAARLRDPSGGYAFRSCKNADDPPYQVVVDMNFSVPQGNSVKFIDDVAAAMISLGWSASETQAEHFGHTLTRSGLIASVYRNPERLDLATMRVYGDCRVVGDHRSDDPVWVDISARLRGAR